MKIQFKSNHLVIFESALFRTTTTLIIAEDHLILVDPNWFPIELQFIQNYISNVNPNKSKYLFFTHSDYDHIIGYNFFMDYKTIASRNFVNQKAKQNILEKITTIDDDNYTHREYDLEYPNIDMVIEENQNKIKIGNKEYQVGYILGHNNDSIYLFDTEMKILIAGDYLSNIEFPYLYYSYAKYIHTLNILSTLIKSGRVDLLIVGHGDYTNDVAEMGKRVDDSIHYLHQVRENCVGKTVFDFEEYVKRFDFPKVMRKFHKANLDLISKELAK